MPPPPRATFRGINRVFWRIVLFVVVSTGLMIVAGAVLNPVFPSGLPFGRPGQVLYYLMFSVALGLAHLAAAFWEKSGDWAILGFAPEGWRPRRIAIAFAGGIGVTVVLAGLLMLFGLARVQEMPAGTWVGYALNALVLLGLATMADAFAFRGYLHGLIERRWGAWVAVGITAVLFTAVHAYASPMGVPHAAATLAAGLFLGAVRARTGGVAAPWMAHLGLLWAQGALMHARIARFALEAPPGYRLVLGPPWFVTGAGWGLDGGLAATVLLLAAAWYLMRPLPLVPPPPARP
jgi:membrane protease YdiL (CAAX protease family)